MKIVHAHITKNAQSPRVSSTDALPTTSTLSRFELKLRQYEAESSAISTGIESLLNHLCDRDRLPTDANFLQFWEGLKHEKDLYGIAQVVLATPATQVSVERAYSGLAQILTNHRTRLTKDHLNDILIIKLNKNIKIGDIIY